MERKQYTYRQHAPQEEDITAFQALLDSVIPGPDYSWDETVKRFEVPGAYPEDTKEDIISNAENGCGGPDD
jgi:hypothetical protein